MDSNGDGVAEPGRIEGDPGAVSHVQHPIWLAGVRAPGALAFAILFSLESISRAVLATVIPLQALALLGDAQRVSVLYFLVSLSSVGFSLLLPWLVRRLRRRFVYSLGAVLLMMAAGLLSTAGLGGQIAGMAARVFGVAALTVCLNLYIMDHIARRDLIRSEPLKMFFAAGAWALGPSLGVYLWTRVAPWAPYALSAASALALLGFFWLLRITESPAVRPASGPPPSVIGNVGRFFGEPRLRLAWLLVVGRSAWWNMFFVYAPLYVVSSGLSELAAGLVVSAGNAVLLLSPLFGWLSHRYGVRQIMIGGFLAAGLATVAVSPAAHLPWLGTGLLLLGTLCMVGLDSVGNIPFLRAVRRRDRPGMTAVFSTYRDVGELAPPGIFAVLLALFELPVVFVASGVSMLVFARLARFIPKRM